MIQSITNIALFWRGSALFFCLLRFSHNQESMQFDFVLISRRVAWKNLDLQQEERRRAEEEDTAAVIVISYSGDEKHVDAQQQPAGW